MISRLTRSAVRRCAWGLLLGALVSAAPNATAEDAAPSTKAASSGASEAGDDGAAPDRHGPRLDLRRISFHGDHYEAPRSDGSGPARLTLDPYLMLQARRLLARARPRRGAIIASDARTGEILVWRDYSRGQGKAGDVLLGHQAPSASVFKIVTTAALLERGHVSPARRVCIVGGHHQIDRRHLRPPPRGADAVCSKFYGALGFSRNAAYAQLVTASLARQDLVEMAEKFRLPGTVPMVGAAVDVGRIDLPFNDLDFARAAAGFQDSALSPLGALYLASVVAHRGQPRWLTILNGDDADPPPLPRALRRRTAINLERMMEVTIHSGTSLEAFTNDKGSSYLGSLRVAGKTGTLQLRKGAPTTSWFVGFAPARRPRIVVSVLLENGRVWRRKANEVARDVLRAYFARAGRRGVTAPFE